ncbi:MAG TPA: hypothetical protein VFI42_16765 [Thermomicrobiaceae bacterium]|nr:hypothetical protein [Thermomicrobiaceae bacterium]
MAQSPEQRAAAYRALLNDNIALVESLPDKEQRIAERVAAGEPIPFIANDESVSEGAVWHLLGQLARFVRGDEPAEPAVTGGLGSDTEPGVTGGYGDTAMGSLDSDFPLPKPGETERPD